MKRVPNTIINCPTNATDSVSLVREWMYNNRSELAAASIGTNLYGYSYDTIGNRLWSAANFATNEYAEAFFNTILPRFEALVRDLPSSATSEIESRYNQAWREGQEESARLANEAHINWYRANGYKLEIKK